MNSKKLLAFPLTEELQYRQNIDSDQLNKMLHSIEESVLRALIRGSETKDLLTRLNLATESSNTSIASEITRIAYLSNAAYANTIFATGFKGAITKVGYSVNQDRGAGHITMPFISGKNLSKVPRYDSDNDGISDSVSPSVKIRIDDDERPADDPVYNMLNRRMDSFWIEQLSVGSHVIEIELPPSLNKKFNYLELLPLPVFGFNITKIEYLDLRSTPIQIVLPTSIVRNGPHILHFAPKQFNNIIRITVDSPDTGIVGFTNIDVALIDYQNTAQTFYMPFENVPTGGTSYTLDVNMDFYIDSPSTNYSNYFKEIMLVTDLNDTLLDTLEVKTDTQRVTGTLDGSLYLKITMQEIDLTTPIIYGCKITLS
jgi:hypothetical protein